MNPHTCFTVRSRSNDKWLQILLWIRMFAYEYTLKVVVSSSTLVIIVNPFYQVFITFTFCLVSNKICVRSAISTHFSKDLAPVNQIWNKPQFVIPNWYSYLITYLFISAEEVLNGVHWSEKLDEDFQANYEQDPTLTWQYFGSASGFFRNYPGKLILTQWL